MNYVTELDVINDLDFGKSVTMYTPHIHTCLIVAKECPTLTKPRMDPSVVCRGVSIPPELFAHLGVKEVLNLMVQRLDFAEETSGLDQWLNATLLCVSD